MSEHDISRVSDILHLQAMKASYCETVDRCVREGRKLAPRFAELFTEDVKADYGMGQLSGRNAVVEFLVDAIVSNNDSLWHSLQTPGIDARGDTAVGCWTVMVRMRPKGSNTFETLFGRYRDEFRRTPQGWRISSIHFTQES